MFKIKRICVPLSFHCNLHCKYCYLGNRDFKSLNFTVDMIDYLHNLSPEWCQCVCATGGEPLLYFDKVKELFSYVPRNVHKKIISNCTLLTQEMVNYINDNAIELSFSHDGFFTKFLRGIDIRKDHLGDALHDGCGIYVGIFDFTGDVLFLIGQEVISITGPPNIVLAHQTVQ